MENNTILNSDIEKTKELFEYEMTEVILKLKGEFAAVSEAKTRYKDASVDSEKIIVKPIALPTVEQETRNIPVPATEIGELSGIKDPVYSLEGMKQNVPTLHNNFAFEGFIADVSIDLPDTSLYHSLNTSVSSEYAVNPVRLSAEKVSSPDVNNMTFFVALPEIDRDKHIDIDVPQYSYAGLPAIEAVNVSHEAGLDNKLIQKFDLSFADMSKANACPKIAIRQMQIPQITKYNYHELMVNVQDKEESVGKVISSMNAIPKSYSFDIPKVEQGAIAVDVPVNNYAVQCMDIHVNSSIDKIRINEIEYAKRAMFSMDALGENIEKVSMLSVQTAPSTLKVVVPENLDKHSVSSLASIKTSKQFPEYGNIEYALPDIRLDSNILCEKIHLIEPIDQTDIPATVDCDYSAYIEDILSSMSDTNS